MEASIEELKKEIERLQQEKAKLVYALKATLSQLKGRNKLDVLIPIIQDALAKVEKK